MSHGLQKSKCMTFRAFAKKRFIISSGNPFFKRLICLYRQLADTYICGGMDSRLLPAGMTVLFICLFPNLKRMRRSLWSSFPRRRESIFHINFHNTFFMILICLYRQLAGADIYVVIRDNALGPDKMPEIVRAFKTVDCYLF